MPLAAHGADSEEAIASASAEGLAPPPASLAPRPSDPLSPTSPTLAPADSSSRKPFKIGVGIDHSIGSGTLAADIYAIVAAKLTVSPSYAFAFRGVELSASANVTGSYEYTPPNNSTNRPYDWADIGLNLSAPSFFTDEKLTGIAVGANVGATLPISLASQFWNVITAFSGGLSLSRTIGKFTLDGRVGASKPLYSSLGPRLPPWLVQQTNRTACMGAAGGQLPSACLAALGTDGVPPLWALSGAVGARYQLKEKVSLSAGFGLGKTFKHVVGVDEFSTQAVYSNGLRVADAQGQSDRMIG
ncbi:MAG TPA: hypothetical protein VE549_10945, partial [Myxococcaceae bacterium]|nr:hypothetical protein [Myxococcaceae bacterium]